MAKKFEKFLMDVTKHFSGLFYIVRGLPAKAGHRGGNCDE